MIAVNSTLPYRWNETDASVNSMAGENHPPVPAPLNSPEMIIIAELLTPVLVIVFWGSICVLDMFYIFDKINLIRTVYRPIISLVVNRP